MIDKTMAPLPDNFNWFANRASLAGEKFSGRKNAC